MESTGAYNRVLHFQNRVHCLGTVFSIFPIFLMSHHVNCNELRLECYLGTFLRNLQFNFLRLTKNCVKVITLWFMMFVLLKIKYVTTILIVRMTSKLFWMPSRVCVPWICHPWYSGFGNSSTNPNHIQLGSTKYHFKNHTTHS